MFVFVFVCVCDREKRGLISRLCERDDRKTKRKGYSKQRQRKKETQRGRERGR